MRGLYRSAALGLAQAYDLVRWSREHATVDTLRKLPNDLSLPRVGIIGGGGCGKTTILQKVGASMFRNLDYLVEMHTMKLFEDPTLIAILQKVRQLHGASSPMGTRCGCTISVVV